MIQGGPSFRRARSPRYFLSLIQGDGQTGTVATALATPLKVRVLTEAGQAVAGQGISWDWQGDGTVDAVSQTDASGYATNTALLGSSVGAQSVVARIIGTGISVTFSVTATAGAAVAIQDNGVTDQSGSPSSTVTAPPSVRIVDAAGNGVPNQAVSWAVTAGGGSINTTGATLTDANGVATLVSWTLGSSAGANRVTATAAGLTGSPITFSANATASAPTQLIVQSGGAQSGTVAGQAAATAITFRVKDAGGTAVAGVTVFFTTDSGTLSAASAVSNGSGDVSVTHTTAALIATATITAQFAKADSSVVSVTTTSASTFGAAAKLGLLTEPSPNCASGTAIPGQPVVAVQDTNNNTVTSASGTMTATIVAGDGSLTGATKTIVAGVATFTALTITDANGGTDLLHFSNGTFGVDAGTATTVAPPVPDRIIIVVQPSGGFAGLTLNTYSVRVADTSNVTIPGYTGPITVSKVTGSGTLSGTLTVNCVNGVATFASTSYSVAESGISLRFADPSGLLTTVTSSTFSVLTQGASNEPVGMTGFAAWPMTSLPSTATVAGSVSFKDGSTYVPPATTNGVTVSPPGVGPDSPNGLYEMHFPKGQIGGQGHGQIYWTGGFGASSARSLYVRWRMKVASNWYGQPIIKMMQLLFNGAGVPNRAIVGYYGSGTGALSARVAYQSVLVINGVNTTGTSYFAPHAGTGVVVRDQWHLWELVIVGNTAGSANGRFQMWLDGTETHNHPNCQFDAGATTWKNVNPNSVYGGSGLDGPDDSYYWIDDLYWSISTGAV